MHGTLTMAKGRKRKNGARDASGRLKKIPQESPRSIAMRQPHRRSVRERDRFDQKAESPLGRLRLRGLITDPQFRSGMRYAEIVMRMMAVIDAPKFNPNSIAGIFEPRIGGGIIADESARRWRGQYDEAFCALGKAGHRAQVIVKDVTVYGRECNEIGILRMGLDALDDYFALTDRRKSDTRKPSWRSPPKIQIT